MNPLHFAVYLHIVAGGVAIVAGTLAMGTRKGSSPHRRFGVLFSLAMLSMSSLAAWLAFNGTTVKAPETGNVFGGIFTFYLVTTAWSSAGRSPAIRTAIDVVALLIGSCLAFTGILIGRQVLQGSGSPSIGPDPGPYFLIGGLALVLVAADVHYLLVGRSPRHRVVRHLWRMGLAFWVAASSLFIGQPRVFPEALRHSYLMFVPSIAIVVLTIYWCVRTLRRGPPEADASDASDADAGRVEPARPIHLAMGRSFRGH